jgi:DMSO/TMAO reductase YedYZ molybdopterin-dependent catalytic subunit
MTVRRGNLWASAVGVIAALVTLAAAEVVALFVAAGSSPVFAVGALVIDLVPGWVKEFVIGLFGTNDKVALLSLLAVIVVALAVGLGILEFRRSPWGSVGLGVLGVIALIASTTRAGANLVWGFPTLVGVALGIFTLRKLVGSLRDWSDAAGQGTAIKRNATRGALTRRRFLTAAGVTAAAALVVGIGARVMNSATTAVNTVREALTLPKPTTPAPPIPPGADLGIPGVAPLISANADFYRIDTALQVPSVDSSTWKLKITGMVANEVEIGFDELLALPLTESVTTLMCVSNEVGGNLIGNAVWLGYPIRELLAKAAPTAGADMVLSTSVDGFTASTPLDVLMDPDRESIFAVGMNGAPLPLEHGFPVRMVVPGLYGYVSATKWVTELKVTTFAQDQAYWTVRGWSDHGPVKTSSRIDVPQDGATVAAGKVAVAGVAWAQHRGISGVEVRVDAGNWVPARLADPISADTWRQWVYEWDATSGNHHVEVRATDATGATQSGNRVDVIPNGAEGWHSIAVSVS